MQVQLRVFCTVFLIVATSLSTLTLAVGTANANTALSSWNGYASGYDSVLLNQTLTKTARDSSVGTELTLGVNLNTLTPDGAYRQLGVDVAVAATTRKSMTLNPVLTTDFDSEEFAAITSEVVQTGTNIALGDDEGQWVDLPEPVWFFGAFYDRAFVAENGFLTFDERAYNDYGAKFTAPIPPATIPTNTDGKINGFIAPFWTDLVGGTIAIGKFTGVPSVTGVVIAWLGVREFGGSGSYNFLVRFIGMSIEYQQRQTIDMIYKEQPATFHDSKAGVEDQEGGIGQAYPLPSGLKRVSITPSASSYFAITNLKTFGDKWKDGPANDNSAQLYIRGKSSQDAHPEYFPGGTNLDLATGQTMDYLHLEYETPWLDALSGYILGYVPYLSNVADTIGFLKELQPTLKGSPSVLNPALYDQEVANTANRATNAILPYNHFMLHYVWSATFLPRYDWSFDPSPSAPIHHLTVRAAVDVVNFFTGASSTVEVSIPLTMNPLFNCGSEQGAAWQARTSPDGYAFNFGLSCQTVGGTSQIVYHIDSTRGSTDSMYTVLGWNPPDSSYDNDYALDANGRIGVKGYFRQTIDLVGANIYAIYAKRVGINGVWNDDNIDRIVATVPVLTPSSGTGWVQANILIDLGSGWAGYRVKLAIGKPVATINSATSIEWAGVSAYLNPIVDFSISACGALTFFNDGSTNPQTCNLALAGSWGSWGPVTLSSSVSPTVSGGPAVLGINPSTVTFGPSGRATAVATLSAGSAVGTFTVTVTAVGGGVTRTAQFAVNVVVPKYLTISAGTGGITNPLPGRYKYTPGAVVTVEASETDPCYYFFRWSLDGAYVYANPITVTMDRNHTLAAAFRKDRFCGMSPAPATMTPTIAAYVGQAPEARIGYPTYTTVAPSVLDLRTRLMVARLDGQSCR